MASSSRSSNFYMDVIQKSAEFHSNEETRNINLLEPVTRKAVKSIIRDARTTYKINLFVTETYRSDERQQLLFEQHKTELRQVGVHHFGLAADFAKLVDGRASWGGSWTFLRALCQKYGLIWGGDWGEPLGKHNFIDRVHVQRIRVADQDKLFSLSWYPDSKYNPYSNYAGV